MLNVTIRIKSIYAAWAEHYGVAIIPARPAKPKDKSQAEGSVGYIERRIFPKLRQQLFFSLEEFNRILALEVDKLNKKSYQKRPGSRQEIFLDIDQPALRPLPAERFQIKYAKFAKISKNDYHVKVEGHWYSAPFHLAGKKVLVVVTDTTVEIIYNNQRLAYHSRCYNKAQKFVTNPDHMPSTHKAQYMADRMSKEKYLAWARSCGPNTVNYLKQFIDNHHIVEQSYQSCMGILRLSTKHSPFLLELACQEALEQGIGGYRQIKTIIEKIAERNHPLENLNHENIRGGEYYQ